MGQLRLILACALLPASAGCMQYLVQPPTPSLAGSPQEVRADSNLASEAEAPPVAGEARETPARSYLGSELQQPPYVLAQRCVDGEQLARVIVKRDFWQGFVSWISLGLIAPATVVYVCGNVGDPPLGNSSGGTGGD
jgi:hypothetical protein